MIPRLFYTTLNIVNFSLEILSVLISGTINLVYCTLTTQLTECAESTFLEPERKRGQGNDK